MKPDQYNKNGTLYLELTRELYLMRKHSFEKDGKYTSLMETIRQFMEDDTNIISQKCRAQKITDEEIICGIYNQYLPHVFRGLPTSFGL